MSALRSAMVCYPRTLSHTHMLIGNQLRAALLHRARMYPAIPIPTTVGTKEMMKGSQTPLAGGENELARVRGGCLGGVGDLEGDPRNHSPASPLIPFLSLVPIEDERSSCRPLDELSLGKQRGTRSRVER